MTIVVTGGGSGGHITPILAVAAELKKLDPTLRVVYIGQRGDALADIVHQNASIDEVYAVRAGKFRRYHGVGRRQLFDVKTQALNLRDALRVASGLWQSYWLLGRLKPEIIFTRGGYVCVPVALAGHAHKIPYITHDSDSTPSLANRLIARWARVHAVALPEELYPYPRTKTVMTGVPVNGSYVLVDEALARQYRHELGLERYKQVICVTGGGNGARGLNEIIIKAAPELLRRYPELALVHMAGRSLEAETNRQYEAILSSDMRQRVWVQGFAADFYRYSGAADIVIARGGATNLAEFAIQGKACIIIPSPQLIWNVKNTDALAERQAVIELYEKEITTPNVLVERIAQLLDNEQARVQLGTRLAALARPDAARQLAMLLLEQTSAAIKNKNSHEISTV